MRFCSRNVIWPLMFLILLGLSAFMIIKSSSVIKKLEDNLVFRYNEVRNKTFSEIRNSEKLVMPVNSSVSRLARVLSSSLNGKEITFPIIEKKVAPPLFLLLSTIPYVSQVSYTGSDGLSFSYYTDDDQTFAVFSNTSSPLVYYSQPVGRDSGKLYGQAISLNYTLAFDANLVLNASHMSMAYSSIEMGWNHDHLLFQNTVPMDGRGMISVGYTTQVIIDLFASIDFHDGDFHLASNDGKELIGTKLPFTQIVVDNGTISIRIMKIDGHLEDKVVNHSCNVDDAELEQFSLKINQRAYRFYCSTLQLAGVKLVYSLAFPSKGMESVARKICKLAITLLVLLLVIIVISISVFIILILRAARREMFLCSALIKQMESTQQAERKSMNKSMAFANASHDVRGSLAAITGLVELCHEDAKPNSELASNLTQINTCTTYVLGILNSVLDTSKIEAGKMQLEVEEFDLAQVLDEVVDMYYPLGFKKGVDVILDPCDGSIFKFYLVKGDRGKLKQILCNLLSNAIKFTSEGHIVVRTVVRKPSKENAIIASNCSSIVLHCLTRLCYKTNGSLSSFDELHLVQEDPNCMEFLFEVEDTGTGIPKEKQKSVFENFVQVKETAFGKDGCGLGLGIVQSLVRLMGGEIRIIDKEHGEKGTCFRFNIFLTCNADSTETEEQGNFIHSGRTSTDVLHYIGLHIQSPMPRLEGSHVILLLAGEERRRISRKVMENFGIKVSVAKRSKDLFCILDMIKQKGDFLQCSSPELSPGNDLPTSSNSDLRGNEGSSSTKDGNDHIFAHKSNSKCPVNFILIIMDANAGPVTELSSIVSSFKKEAPNIKSKVVWLENPTIRNGNLRKPGENKASPPCDYIMSKPLHGSRLYQLLGFLPEFGSDQLKVRATNPTQENQHFPEIIPSNNLTRTSHGNELQKGTVSSGQKQQLEEIIIYENTDKTSEKPLEGKSVLVVDDDAILRKLTSTVLSRLGAKVDVCVNGKEASDLVCNLLRDQKLVHPQALPFDFIFMDCEMPVMDGREATKLIRMEEKSHGIHIPIFALTAHAMAEATRKTVDAGMDFHLSKPLKVDKLLEAIRLVLSVN